MADAGRVVRIMAAVAVVAVLLAQGVAPGLKGAATGMGRLIDSFDLAAGIASHLLALGSSALCIVLLLLIVRNRNVSIVTRVLVVALTTIVLLLAVPASRLRLSDQVCFLLGMAASTLAAVSAVEGLRQARSRALGLVIAALSLGALSHVVAAGVAATRPEAVTLSRVMSSVSFFLYAAGLTFSLVWLASRRKRIVLPPTSFALAAAFFVAWASTQARGASAPGWMVFAYRLVDGLSPVPAPAISPLMLAFAVLFGPLLAVVAVFTRRQMASVTGAMALALTAGVAVDVPGRALILTLAGLATVLASRDERGMWEAITGEAPSTSPPPEAT